MAFFGVWGAVRAIIHIPQFVFIWPLNLVPYIGYISYRHFPPPEGIVIGRVCLLAGWFVRYIHCDFLLSPIFSLIWRRCSASLSTFTIDFSEVKVKVQGQSRVKIFHL